jgi:hypothetical protein
MALFLWYANVGPLPTAEMNGAVASDDVALKL